jgi:hypothetical protein
MKCRKGDVCYRIDVSEDRERVEITRWKYEGFRYVGDVSSTSCERPYHFCVFKFLDRWEVRRKCSRKGEFVGVNIPSRKQAMMTMLTLDELVAEIEQKCQSGRRGRR